MSFVAQITADISNFDKNIKKATDIADSSTKKMQAQFDKLGNSFVKIGAKASILSTAIVGATVGIVKLGISAGDASAEINNLSTATSLSTDLIQELSYVATASNSSFEGLQRSMDSFQRRLKTVGEEGSRVNEMFGKLGVSTTDASGKVRSMDDVLLDTFNRLGDMEDGLAKNAIGSELFGRSWNEVALIVSSGSKGIAELREEAHKLGLVLDKDTLQSSDDFATAMELVRFQIDKLKTKIGASLVPILQESLLPLLEEKIIPAVSRFAENIARLSEKFNALSPTTKNAIFAITGIATAIGPLLLGLGSIIKLLPIIKVGLVALTGPVGAIIATAVAGIALIIANWDMLKGSISKDLDFLKDRFAITGDAAGKLFSGNFKGWWDTVKQGFDADIDYLKRRWSEFKELFGGGGELDASAGMLAGALGGGNNITEQTDKVKALLAEIDRLKEIINDLNKSGVDTSKTFEDTRNTFDKFISSTNSISEAVVVTTQTIANLKQRILDLQTGKLFSDDITGEIQEYTSLIKELETGLDTLTRGTWNVDFKVNGKPLGDAANEVKDFTGVITDRFNAAIEKAQQYALDFNNVATGLVSDLATAFGQSIGDKDLKFGDEMLKVLASLLQQLGSMAVAFGAWSLGLQPLMANPLSAPAAAAAMIAGAAAIAAGAAIKSAQASKSLGGGGYSSAPSLKNTSPSYAPSEYRGAYQDDFKVEFRIGSNELVGVLDTAEQRRNRL
jgi:uncharacterized coiled-coil protein SlyX